MNACNLSRRGEPIGGLAERIKKRKGVERGISPHYGSDWKGCSGSKSRKRPFDPFLFVFVTQQFDKI